MIAAVATLAGGLAACADDGADEPTPPGANEAVPAPEVSSFSTGSFDDISLPRGATEVSERTERDGAVAQSFTVTATSPSQVMDFFEGTLAEDGWTLLEAPVSTGTDSIAGSWSRGGRRLDVSALLAQGIDGEQTQFSLVLLPSLADADAIEGG